MDTPQIAKTLIDLVIEQAEINDGRNLKIEQTIIKKVLSRYDSMGDRILSTIGIHGNIDSVLKYNNLMNRLQVIVEEFYADAYRIMTEECLDYLDRGYEQMGNLIETGIDAEKNLRAEVITELKKQIVPDQNTIEFMRTHAFEQVKGFSSTILESLRSTINQEMLTNKYNKKSIMDKVEKNLGVLRSRAETIAQTEMSMAYNNGELERIREFNKMSDTKMKKYWHGFKFSESTCSYCRPRIGNVYDVDNTLEVLPAHPRCRCIWIPYMDNWDKPISKDFTRNADMLARVYKPEEIYTKLNTKLGIDYAQYLKTADAAKYLSGDRTADFYKNLSIARDKAIKDKGDSFDIAIKIANDHMKSEYEMQIKFWIDYVSENIVDNNDTNLVNAYNGIKGVMLLQWSPAQLLNFSKLLDIIKGHIK